MIFQKSSSPAQHMLRTYWAGRPRAGDVHYGTGLSRPPSTGSFGGEDPCPPRWFVVRKSFASRGFVVRETLALRELVLRESLAPRGIFFSCLSRPRLPWACPVLGFPTALAPGARAPLPGAPPGSVPPVFPALAILWVCFSLPGLPSGDRSLGLPEPLICGGGSALGSILEVF